MICTGRALGLPSVKRIIDEGITNIMNGTSELVPEDREFFLMAQAKKATAKKATAKPAAVVELTPEVRELIRTEVFKAVRAVAPELEALQKK
tara:strand:+ start:1222 stop:1497 length:276 start_codon:yes stop_codon:yes gene_type:complete